jgi:hypothetical protein
MLEQTAELDDQTSALVAVASESLTMQNIPVVVLHAEVSLEDGEISYPVLVVDGRLLVDFKLAGEAHDLSDAALAGAPFTVSYDGSDVQYSLGAETQVIVPEEASELQAMADGCVLAALMDA